VRVVSRRDPERFVPEIVGSDDYRGAIGKRQQILKYGAPCIDFWNTSDIIGCS